MNCTKKVCDKNNGLFFFVDLLHLFLLFFLSFFAQSFVELSFNENQIQMKRAVSLEKI